VGAAVGAAERPGGVVAAAVGCRVGARFAGATVASSRTGVAVAGGAERTRPGVGVRTLAAGASGLDVSRLRGFDVGVGRGAAGATTTGCSAGSTRGAAGGSAMTGAVNGVTVGTSVGGSGVGDGRGVAVGASVGTAGSSVGIVSNVGNASAASAA
jgi:hypothetical protein